MSVRVRYSDELYHYGIKGQKWGVRRYQNEDGTLTPAGRERYGDIDSKTARKRIKNDIKYENRRARGLMDRAAYAGGYHLQVSNFKSDYEHRIAKRKAKGKDTKDLERKLNNVNAILEAATQARVTEDNRVKEHYDYLIKQYGSENVKPIKFDKKGYIKPSKLNNAKRFGKAAKANILYNLILAPLGMIGFVDSSEWDNPRSRGVLDATRTVNKYNRIDKDNRKLSSRYV